MTAPNLVSQAGGILVCLQQLQMLLHTPSSRASLTNSTSIVLGIFLETIPGHLLLRQR